MQRRRHVVKLRAQGLTLNEIARRFGVTKQAVWSLLNARPRVTRARAVSCTSCGAQIVSAGALPRDAASALCVSCLEDRGDVAFGRRLKSLRLAAGLTQADLSKRTGVSPGALRAYEEERRLPRRATVLRLARAVGPGLITRRAAPRPCVAS